MTTEFTEKHGTVFFEFWIRNSPLSSMLPHILLQEIEKQIINIIGKCDNEGKWIRYKNYGLYTTNNNNKYKKKFTVN